MIRTSSSPTLAFPSFASSNAPAIAAATAASPDRALRNDNDGSVFDTGVPDALTAEGNMYAVAAGASALAALIILSFLCGGIGFIIGVIIATGVGVCIPEIAAAPRKRARRELAQASPEHRTA